MTRAGALLVAAALTCGLAVTSASAAGGACPELEDGVTVVVDFQSLGGGTVVRCAPGDPDSGLAALAAAGFRVDQVASQPGFVCRIDGLPGPETEDCADTPPARAYWGYSHAERGGSWSYSGSGAHVYDPPVGTVEGWAFNGDGGSTQPTIPPPPPPEPEPEPQPDPSPSSPPKPKPSPPPSTPQDAPTSARPAATEEPAREPATATPSPSSAATTPEAGATSPADGISPDRPEGVTDPTTDVEAAVEPATGGTPWGVVIGGLLVAIMVLVGFLVRSRRGRRP